MKIWVTRYALTKGIYAAEAEKTDTEGMLCVGYQYFHGEGKQWHRTEADALKQAISMAEKKAQKLYKQHEEMVAYVDELRLQIARFS
jgi:hypothetical protein